MLAVPVIQVDNDTVRVTEWRFAPGAETGPHVHEMDYIVVPLGDGFLRIVSPDGSEQTSELRRGESYFRSAGVAHNVINASDTDFSFVEVELQPTRNQRGDSSLD